jgi:hypothetical protein
MADVEFALGHIRAVPDLFGRKVRLGEICGDEQRGVSGEALRVVAMVTDGLASPLPGAYA